MAYTTIPASTTSGGSSLPTWASARLAEAQAIDSTIDRYYYDDAMTGWTTGVNNAAGTVATTSPSAAIVSTTAATTHSGDMVPPGSPKFIPNLKTGKYLWCARAKLVGAADANSNHWIFAADDATASGGFKLIGSTDPTRWYIYAGGSPSAGSGSAALADFTTLHNFEVTCDGTTLNYLIDGVSIGSLANTSMPSAAGINHFLVQSGGTAANRQIQVNALFVAWRSSDE